MSGSRIDALLSEMTLAEKIGQLNMLAAGFSVTGPIIGGDATGAVREGRAGSLLNVFGPSSVRDIQRVAIEESRLKIPLILGFDVVHGHRTVFPVPLGEAAAFDPALWEATARASAREAAADGVALTFAPMLDVSRDPRWGRVVEGPGEDPFVHALFGAAKVRGFQGDALDDPSTVAATVKHFVGYGAAAAGRDYASTDMSERTLRETYLPPFQAAIAAGCAAVMPAFSDLSGVPMTANGPLLTSWLRREAGFEGVVISDYNAVAELVAHGVATDLAEAAALALRAGVDVDMMSGAYERGLPDALSRGLVTLAEIETSVRRVLQLKERLGLFDDPMRGLRDQGAAPLLAEHRPLAREAARRSAVLLSNRNDILPIAANPLRIAMVGPLGDAPTDMMGSWSGAGEARDSVTFLRGLREARPDCDIGYARGVGVDEAEEGGPDAALELARAADLVILAIGEARDMSGEAASRTGLDLPGDQANFARAVLALGRPTVVVLSSGRPLAVPWLFERADAVLATWFLGSEAGHALADLLTGRAAPSGRLPLTWPRSVGQVPIFFGERPSGRPASDGHYTSKYIDLPTTPLFAFGHGLTYGHVRYASLSVEPSRPRRDDAISVSVELANEGVHAAEETVFLFVRKPVSRVARPLLELKGFLRMGLEPGERARGVLTLPVSALAFPGPDLTSSVEPGDYEILVGPSADRTRLLRQVVHIEEGGA
ncbi:glycoside hydrolase family 3 N-terminal domain-containing protein [Aureimonas ureilytica]|uniref:glycoside hydrolase family 3 N-terminal domain-containing protein n=1 Tax=Aureimonas ureilytica TaxID=401562 RepID=UPI000369A4B8|nr:glycoside hydrolase family 3 N-terminal domain-containing protein [Aureimonas ureilytica]